MHHRLVISIRRSPPAEAPCITPHPVAMDCKTRQRVPSSSACKPQLQALERSHLCQPPIHGLLATQSLPLLGSKFCKEFNSSCRSPPPVCHRLGSKGDGLPLLFASRYRSIYFDNGPRFCTRTQPSPQPGFSYLNRIAVLSLIRDTGPPPT